LGCLDSPITVIERSANLLQRALPSSTPTSSDARSLNTGKQFDPITHVAGYASLLRRLRRDIYARCLRTDRE
jgi:hypothetical protein